MIPTALLPAVLDTGYNVNLGQKLKRPPFLGWSGILDDENPKYTESFGQLVIGVIKSLGQ